MSGSFIVSDFVANPASVSNVASVRGALKQAPKAGGCARDLTDQTAESS